MHSELDSAGCVELANELALQQPRWAIRRGHVGLARVYAVCVAEQRGDVAPGTTAQLIDSVTTKRPPWWRRPVVMVAALGGLAGVAFIAGRR